MRRIDRIGQYLRIHRLSHGQLHIDSLKIPPNYPADLAAAAPALIREDLAEHGMNFTPLIVRPCSTPNGDTEYEVIFGKEVVEFAPELGIEQLWASILDLAEEEVPPFQERLKAIFQLKAAPRETAALEVAPPPPKADPVQPEAANVSQHSRSPSLDLGLLLKDQSKILEKVITEQNSLKTDIDKLTKTVSELMEIVRQLQQSLTATSRHQAVHPPQTRKTSRRSPQSETIWINRCSKPQNLKDRVPGLTLEEAKKIIAARNQGRRFYSVDELKEIAPSGQWDQPSLVIMF